MVNVRSKIERLKLRSTIIAGIRDFFVDEGFLEVETPLLLASADPEPTIQVFETNWQFAGEKKKCFLATSPEFQMKKILAEGSGPIFQICKAFRNDEPSARLHNPEFTMLEWYRPNADYTQLMSDCEHLVRAAAAAAGVLKNNSIEYQGKQINLSQPWQRLSVLEAFEQYAGIDEKTFFDLDLLTAAARQKGYQVSDNTSFDEIFYQIVLNEIEPHLGHDRPTFLYDYPTSQAALARVKPGDKRLAERLELYIGNLEIANGFSELVDWQEQRQRFEAQFDRRQELGLPTWQIDEHFIAALKSGLPPTAGIALGIDRLVMLLANSGELADVIAYPTGQLFDQSVV